MGLDGVEIVMKAEEAFGIQIEDAEAEAMRTPRDLIECVMKKIEPAETNVCLTQRAFNRIRSLLVKREGFERKRIRPDMRMNDLLNPKSRQQFLQQVLADTGLMMVPELVRPSWVVLAAFVISMSAGAAVVFFLISSHFFSSNDAAKYLFFLGTLSAMLAGWLLTGVTEGMRREFDRKISTVGDLSRWIAAQGPTLHDPPISRWTREQVSLKVREIVIDILDCEKIYGEDASFIKDLGLN